MDWYPHHIGDFLAATTFLTNDERYIYLQLMWMYYDKERPIEDDVIWLTRRTGAEYENQVETVLKEFFELRDGHWHHGRIDGEIATYQARVEQRKAAGKASGRARRKERPFNGRSTSVEQTTTTTTTTTDKKNGRKKPAVFAPPDLSEVKTYFADKKLNGDPEHFFDHFENCDWKLSSGRGKKMKSWTLAANNWSRTQSTFDPKAGNKVNGKLVLPKEREAWGQFAAIHKLPQVRSGESWEAWGGRLQSAIEQRRNQHDGR